MLPAISKGSRSPILVLFVNRKKQVSRSLYHRLAHSMGGHNRWRQNRLRHVLVTWKWLSFAGVNEGYFHARDKAEFEEP